MSALSRKFPSFLTNSLSLAGTMRTNRPLSPETPGWFSRNRLSVAPKVKISYSWLSDKMASGLFNSANITSNDDEWGFISKMKASAIVRKGHGYCLEASVHCHRNFLH
ncbi:hypothetical protein SUGI_0873870 [Cryptomeria japonica]|nr:hypothetical protein SUGI_0873870 [Cryptomeria japonica]